MFVQTLSKIWDTFWNSEVFAQRVRPCCVEKKRLVVFILNLHSYWGCSMPSLEKAHGFSTVSVLQRMRTAATKIKEGPALVQVHVIIDELWLFINGKKNCLWWAMCSVSRRALGDYLGDRFDQLSIKIDHKKWAYGEDNWAIFSCSSPFERLFWQRVHLAHRASQWQVSTWTCQI